MVKVGTFIIISAKKLQSLEVECDQLQQKYKKLYAQYIETLNHPPKGRY